MNVLCVLCLSLHTHTHTYTHIHIHTHTHAHTHTHIYYYFIIVLPNNYRQFQRCPDPPLTLADPECVVKATKCLKNATRPLIVIGKGILHDV